MIAAALAAQTAATLVQSLAGKHRTDAGPQTGGGGGGFGAQLDALLPGAGSTLTGLGALGQTLLGTLGIGHGAASSSPAQPSAAAQAYAASGALLR